MIREKYESLAVHDLKEIAKARGIKGLSTMKKAEVIDAMLRLDAQENAEIKTERSVPENRPAERKDAPEKERGRAGGCSKEGRSRAARMLRRGARQSARMPRRRAQQSGRMLRRGMRQSARIPRRRAQWKSRILMTVGQNRRAKQGIGRKDGSREQESASSAMVLIIMDGQEAATTMVRGKILQLQRPVLLRLWQKRHRTV